jgi:hypothetical protein
LTNKIPRTRILESARENIIMSNQSVSGKRRESGPIPPSISPAISPTKLTSEHFSFAPLSEVETSALANMEKQILSGNTSGFETASFVGSIATLEEILGFPIIHHRTGALVSNTRSKIINEFIFLQYSGEYVKAGHMMASLISAGLHDDLVNDVLDNPIRRREFTQVFASNADSPSIELERSEIAHRTFSAGVATRIGIPYALSSQDALGEIELITNPPIYIHGVRAQLVCDLTPSPYEHREFNHIIFALNAAGAKLAGLNSAELTALVKSSWKGMEVVRKRIAKYLEQGGEPTGFFARYLASMAILDENVQVIKGEDDKIRLVRTAPAETTISVNTESEEE